MCIPSLMFLYSAMQAPNYFYQYYGTGQEEWLGFISYSFSMIAHWLFSTQYFKTSQILPVMLKQVEFEKFQNRDGGINIKLLESAMIKHKINYSLDKYELLRTIDEKINENASRVKKIQTRI